ncbi:class I SAM-dependent methyltransferase [Sulfurimonas sp.]|uniref:class I SAM-dependent methyltransferase n=1 Tax=Sulfurimonas sp. TaxID=2022749 RepID=UPI003567ACAF
MQAKKRYPGGSDPKGFDSIVREVFAPIYPVIAEQILSKTQKKDGMCLDVGCGTGALGRAVAKLSNMNITFFDQSPEMIDLSISYAHDENLIERSEFIVGDIHDLALNDNSVDLIVSRGSVPFWSDLEMAYKELFRVLKKGGHAYIGGGFGNEELREEIVRTMNERNKEWRSPFKDKARKHQEIMPSILNGLNSSYSNIINDESGFWVHIVK